MPGSSGVNDARVAEAVANGDLDEADLDRAITRNIALGLSSLSRQKPATPSDPDEQHRLARKLRRNLACYSKMRNNYYPFPTVPKSY